MGCLPATELRLQRPGLSHVDLPDDAGEEPRHRRQRQCRKQRCRRSCQRDARQGSPQLRRQRQAAQRRPVRRRGGNRNGHRALDAVRDGEGGAGPHRQRLRTVGQCLQRDGHESQRPHGNHHGHVHLLGTSRRQYRSLQGRADDHGRQQGHAVRLHDDLPIQLRAPDGRLQGQLHQVVVDEAGIHRREHDQHVRHARQSDLPAQREQRRDGGCRLHLRRERPGDGEILEGRHPAVRLRGRAPDRRRGIRLVRHGEVLGRLHAHQRGVSRFHAGHLLRHIGRHALVNRPERLRRQLSLVPDRGSEQRRLRAERSDADIGGGQDLCHPQCRCQHAQRREQLPALRSGEHHRQRRAAACGPDPSGVQLDRPGRLDGGQHRREQARHRGCTGHTPGAPGLRPRRGRRQRGRTGH